MVGFYFLKSARFYFFNRAYIFFFILFPYSGTLKFSIAHGWVLPQQTRTFLFFQSRIYFFFILPPYSGTLIFQSRTVQFYSGNMCNPASFFSSFYFLIPAPLIFQSHMVGFYLVKSARFYCFNRGCIFLLILPH